MKIEDPRINIRPQIKDLLMLFLSFSKELLAFDVLKTQKLLSVSISQGEHKMQKLVTFLILGFAVTLGTINPAHAGFLDDMKKKAGDLTSPCNAKCSRVTCLKMSQWKWCLANCKKDQIPNCTAAACKGACNRNNCKDAGNSKICHQNCPASALKNCTAANTDEAKKATAIYFTKDGTMVPANQAGPNYVDSKNNPVKITEIYDVDKNLIKFDTLMQPVDKAGKKVFFDEDGHQVYDDRTRVFPPAAAATTPATKAAAPAKK